MARHTPEPWRIEGRYIMGLKVKAISEIPQYGVREAWVDRANRHRIVACVNACAGLGNEALEASIIRRLRESLEWAAAVIRAAHDGRLSASRLTQFGLEELALAEAAVAEATKRPAALAE